jgi:hypothetical protein
VLGGNLNFQRIIGSGSLQFSGSKNRHPFSIFWKIFRTDELSVPIIWKNFKGIDTVFMKEWAKNQCFLMPIL